MSLYNVMAERLRYKEMEKMVKISLPRSLKGGLGQWWPDGQFLWFFDPNIPLHQIFYTSKTQKVFFNILISVTEAVNCPNKAKWSFALAWSFAGFQILTSNIHLPQATKNLPGIAPTGLQFELCVSWMELFQLLLFLLGEFKKHTKP